jgi:hypothetical protein
LSRDRQQKASYYVAGFFLYLYAMENNLGQNYVKYAKLSKMNMDNMSIQELFNHRFELITLRDKGLRMLNEMESNTLTQNN